MNKSEARREALRVREVRKYRPRRTSQSPNGRHRQDVALHAMLQLIPWRLRVARAMVSLIDKDQQFIIAESTCSSDIEGFKPPSDPSDELWLGCQGVLDRADTLCQYTFTAPAPSQGYAIFQVSDLQKDPQFQHIPSVRNPPYLRFYAGTPLVSPQGLTVGTLCILDEKTRHPLNDDEQLFFGAMAAAVMRHLELESEMQLHSRYTNMSRGLADLVLRENACIDNYHLNEMDETTPPPSPGWISAANDPETPFSDEPLSTLPDSAAGPYTYRKVFTTAADILRHSLDSDLAILAENFTDLKSWSMSQEMRLGLSYSAGKRPFMESILAYEHPEDIIKTLCQRWPLGKIWVRDDTNFFVGVEDERFRPTTLSREQRRPSVLSSDSQPDSEECEWLHNWLPHARQVMFVPLWDPTTTEEPSACFVMTQKNTPQFAAQVEVPFIRAFLNSLSVICGHLTLRLAEQQKDQLLSSISHELRSPLHGIIASVEMLSATALTQKQLDLAESIDVCSQTLLDTLSLVMDHAMVNSFVEGRSKNPFTKNAGPTVHAGSSLHLESTCNLAALCEEGIDITKTAFRNLAKSGAGQTTSKEHVEIDFRASRADWTFTCTPGVIRRLVMNLVSNSMKYTASGSIFVDLTQEDDDTENAKDTSRVILTVSDTGKGISSAYLKNGLFVPFSQESSTAPGLGLGLSIVRASIASLGGHIDVESAENHGTTVTISFPARRPLSADLVEPSKYDIAGLRPLVEPPGKTYRIFGPSLPGSRRYCETLAIYLEGWWLHQHVEEVDTVVDFTFVDERDLIFELPASHHYIVIARSALSEPFRRTSEATFTYLKVPFGPKALGKVLQYATLGRRVSSASSVTEGLSQFQLGPQRSESVLTKPGTPNLDVKQSSQLQHADARPPLTRPLTSSSIGISTPKSPQLVPNRRPVDHLTGAKHAHSDAIITRTSSPAVRGTSVLCVDDNGINLRLLQTYCTKLGFNRVVTAEDGLQAVQAVKEATPPGAPPTCVQPFDVIFMDLTMPICDGFEATRRIRELEREWRTLAPTDTESSPETDDLASVSGRPVTSSDDPVEAKLAPVPRATVIAITALASEADQKKAFNAGIDHFVTKPLRFKDLKALLTDLKVL